MEEERRDKEAPYSVTRAIQTQPPVKPGIRLLDRVRMAIRTRHYSRRTEKAYVHWILQYIFFLKRSIQRRWALPRLVSF
jgi:hypothetical protein